MPIYRWLCPHCRSAYILPRHQKHNRDHWRCYTCDKVFANPHEAGTMMWDDHFEAPLNAWKPDNWAETVRNYRGPYRFPEEMMLYVEKPESRESEKKHRSKRNRATALVVNDSKLLLVRESGAKQWSLPGGGIEQGESILTSVRRELDEETGLNILEASFLFDYESHTQHHHVCLLSVDGRIRLQKKELSDFRWWNGQTQLPIIPSAAEIIKQARAGGYLDVGKSDLVR